MGLCQSLDVLQRGGFLADGEFEREDMHFFPLFIFLFLGKLDGINPLREGPAVMASAPEKARTRTSPANILKCHGVRECGRR